MPGPCSPPGNDESYHWGSVRGKYRAYLSYWLGKEKVRVDKLKPRVSKAPCSWDLEILRFCDSAILGSDAQAKIGFQAQ